MVAATKIIGWVMVLLLPGGIFLLCGFFFGRALRAAYLRVKRAAPDAVPTPRAVFAELSFRQVWREARAAL